MFRKILSYLPFDDMLDALASCRKMSAFPNGDEASKIFEPTGCDTDQLASERTLRIIEQGRTQVDNIDDIYRLCWNAGPLFNRAALRRNDAMDDVPF